MNTASRMESNGAVGKIHVSQATAEELIHQGKSHWITPRPDKVLAKGKGELQTYWVSVCDHKLSKSVATRSADSSLGHLIDDEPITTTTTTTTTTTA
jgi:hypothetical protein